jgi:nitroimidazol reductase NimA-like FMN-containing flavoprotein (pyridoxamine 5'-phosphate oxidase superfamily)
MDQTTSTRKAVQSLLHHQQLGVLSTVDNDMPYANLVAFATSDDDRYLYFVTPRATRKFANLSANANVALLVDNSSNHRDDFQQAAAVTAVGKATSVSAPVLAEAQKLYIAKHPHLEDFVHSSDCEMICIRVMRYILVERFQNVTEYRIDHAEE